MKAVTHLEKVIVGEVSAVTHLEKVIAEETSAVTYTEKVIAGVATPITHLQKVIAGVASPVTHLEQVWAGGSPTPSEHEYTGAVPVTIPANGQPLLDYTIYGNMSQSGTPTQETPIQPQGTGERTGNLWNAEGFSARAITSTHEHANTNSYGTTISSTIGKEVSVTQANYPTGNVGYQNGFFFLDVDFSKYSIGDVITLSFDYTVDDVHALSTQTSTTLYAGANSNAITPTLTSGDWKISGRLIVAITIIANMNPYVEVRLCGNSITVKNIMLNSGSTPLPYEPFGVKIPISSANTTTPVYLGEVETTRKIKKYEFTGQESWSINDATGVFYTFAISDFFATNGTTCVCSHYSAQNNVTGVAEVQNKRICFRASTYKQFYLKDTDFDSTDALKSYLAQQYAAGTPVTVWYVLATETTGIVNEPLRKIGDYADTISMEQAGVSIPTVKGNTVIDVDTTLKPSEMYIKYKG